MRAMAKRPRAPHERARRPAAARGRARRGAAPGRRAGARRSGRRPARRCCSAGLAAKTLAVNGSRPYWSRSPVVCSSQQASRTKAEATRSKRHGEAGAGIGGPGADGAAVAAPDAPRRRRQAAAARRRGGPSRRRRTGIVGTPATGSGAYASAAPLAGAGSRVNVGPAAQRRQQGAQHPLGARRERLGHADEDRQLGQAHGAPPAAHARRGARPLTRPPSRAARASATCLATVPRLEQAGQRVVERVQAVDARPAQRAQPTRASCAAASRSRAAPAAHPCWRRST